MYKSQVKVSEVQHQEIIQEKVDPADRLSLY